MKLQRRKFVTLFAIVLFSVIAQSAYAIAPGLSVTVSDTVGCAGTVLPITSNVSGGDGAYSYQWKGDVSILDKTDVSNPDIKASTQPGVYSLTLSVEDGSSNVGESTAATFVIGSNPSVTIPDQSACQGVSLDVKSAVIDNNGVGIESYAWEYGGTVVLLNTTTVVPTVPDTEGVGIFDIKLVVMDSAGCYGSDLAQIRIHELPTVLVVDTSICPVAGTQIATPQIIVNSGAAIVQYEWTDPDGILSSTSVMQPSFNGSNMNPLAHSIYLTVTDANNCISKDAAGTLTILEIPTVVVDDASGCVGEPLPVASTVTNGFAPYAFAWSGAVSVLDDASISSPTIQSTASPDTYSLVLSVEDGNGCVGKSSPAQFVIGKNPVVSVPDQETSFGTQLKVQSSVLDQNGQGIEFYEWSYGGTKTLVDKNTAKPIVPETEEEGIYKITLEVTDSTGCSVVSDVASIKVGNPTSVSESGKNATVSVYPNPSSGVFVIEASDLGGGNSIIKVFNSAGTQVEYSEVEGEAFVKGINISGLPQGVYMLRVENDTVTYVERIVIQ